MSRSDRDQARIEAAEEEYIRVKDALTTDDKERVYRQRDLDDAGEPNHYGHDLLAAVQRGYSYKAQEGCAEAMRWNARRNGVAASKSPARSAFSLTLTSLIQAAAREGVTAEQVRSVLERELACTDALRIERTVERALEDGE